MQNRIKKTILCIFMFILCFSLFSCKDKDNDKDDDGGTTTPPPADILELIGLDISGYVSKYEIGEELNINDLKAFAHYEDNTTKDVTEAIHIDTSKYNKDKDGTYEIIISYLENNILAKSFFLATVGTGINDDGNQGDNDEKVFGPGIYTLDMAVALQDYGTDQPVTENTSFVDGYYVLKGTNAKRANSSQFALFLEKEELSWIEFDVNGTSTVTNKVSSTGGTNTSVVAIYDSENSLVQNNENITDVYGTTETVITYTLTTGYYRLLSPAGMTNST